MKKIISVLLIVLCLFISFIGIFSNEVRAEDPPIFRAPEKNETGGSAGDSLDDMITGADRFVNGGNTTEIYDESDLENFSTNMFNIFSTVGSAVAIIVGITIGISYMVASVEAKADIKKMLVPYLIGCLVVFGGFGVWKLAIIILSSV